jgi:hypothetical protein
MGPSDLSCCQNLWVLTGEDLKSLGLMDVNGRSSPENITVHISGYN